MSERVATADITKATDRGVTEPQGAEPELAAEDLLVEEVSIDGMCGVY
jgi:mycofactocin precursor